MKAVFYVPSLLEDKAADRRSQRTIVGKIQFD
jgi:hypothetical protein